MKAFTRETRNGRFAVLVVAVLAMGASTSIADADVWFCSSEDATGFKEKDGRWISGGFVDTKFKLKFGETVGQFTSITLAGVLDDNLLMRCWQNEVGVTRGDGKIYWDTFFCGSDYGSYFSINRATGHYVMAASLGWLLDTAKTKDADTVSIERGTCTKF